jgi:hypothetical protein
MMSAARTFPVRWIPACAGMTNFGFNSYFVIPAKAGTQREKARAKRSVSRAPID